MSRAENTFMSLWPCPARAPTPRIATTVNVRTVRMTASFEEWISHPSPTGEDDESSGVRALRLIHTGHAAEADRDPVPGVDRGHSPRQVRELPLGELPPRLSEQGIADALADARDGLGPGQCRPLPVGEEGRLAPGVQRVDPLLRLPRRPGVLRVHVDAIGAAVDLRRPDLD